MICIKCGAEISDGCKFCENCGSAQNQNDEVKDDVLTNVDEIRAEAEKAETSPVLELPEVVVDEIHEDVKEKDVFANSQPFGVAENEPKVDFEVAYDENDNLSQPHETLQDNAASAERFVVPKKKFGAGKIVAIILVAVMVLGAVGVGISFIGGKSYKTAEDVMDAYFKCLSKNDIDGVAELMEPSYFGILVSYFDNDVSAYLHEYDYGFYAGYAGMDIKDIKYEYMLSATQSEIDGMMTLISPEKEWESAEVYDAYVTFENGLSAYFSIITVKAGGEYTILSVE